MFNKNKLSVSLSLPPGWDRRALIEAAREPRDFPATKTTVRTEVQGMRIKQDAISAKIEKKSAFDRLSLLLHLPRACIKCRL